ncbi:metal-sulfur cluster biosynthetic enzyme [Halobacteriales archaeon QS_8_69_26]|nr:MAG: metal-sulfur cluster biosynthetic enzyme [Halobacteriales archaeon QS_8_69_26]
MSYDPSVEADPDLDPAGDPENPNAVGSAACSYTEYEYGSIPDAADLPATGEGSEGLAADVWNALYGVDDPEMPISVVDLGLIYRVDVDEGGDGSEAGDGMIGAGDEGASVTIDMTLTYSGCPARDMLTGEVEEAVASVEGVEDVTLRLVWSPEWSLDMVTEAGKERLREFGLSVE